MKYYNHFAHFPEKKIGQVLVCSFQWHFGFQAKPEILSLIQQCPNQCFCCNNMCVENKFPNHFCVWAQCLGSANIWPQSCPWFRVYTPVYTAFCKLVDLPFNGGSSLSQFLNSFPVLWGMVLTSVPPLLLHSPTPIPLKVSTPAITVPIHPASIPPRKKCCKTPFK